MSNKKMMSVNLKKIGARTSVNRLVRENYRDKKMPKTMMTVIG